MELYGPQGLRRFIRENLHATRANLLIGPFDSELPCRDDGQLRHHPNESAGRNLETSEEGLWRDIVVNEARVRMRWMCEAMWGPLGIEVSTEVLQLPVFSLSPAQ